VCALKKEQVATQFKRQGITGGLLALSLMSGEPMSHPCTPSPAEDAVDERSGGGIPAVAAVGTVAPLLFGSVVRLFGSVVVRLAAAVAAVTAARALATASLCLRFSTTYHTYLHARQAYAQQQSRSSRLMVVDRVVGRRLQFTL
jgi:hypothetical protein